MALTGVYWAMPGGRTCGWGLMGPGAWAGGVVGGVATGGWARPGVGGVGGEGPVVWTAATGGPPLHEATTAYDTSFM